MRPGFARESLSPGGVRADADAMRHVEAYGGTLLSRVLAAVATLSLHILIARSVTPAEYGAVAFLVTALAILLLLLSFGNEPLLIREGGAGSSRALSVAVCAPGFALVFALLLGFGATGIEHLFSIPGLARMLIWGLPALPLQALQVLPRAELLRRQEFLRLARTDALSNILAWIPAVGLFFMTGDIAAFALYLVAMHLLRAAAYWRQSGIVRTSVAGQAVRLRSYLSGWRIFSIESSTFLTTTFDDLVVAGNLGAAMLGVYHLAYRVITVTQDFFSGVMRVLSYPRYALAAPDRRKVYRLFCADTRFVVAVILPVLATVLVTADVIVPMLLGAAWSDAVFVFQLLTAEAMRQSLLSLGGQALVALGDERRLLRYALTSAGVLLPTFILLSFTDLRTFVVGFVAVNSVLNLYFFLIIRRSYAHAFRPLLLAWMPGLLAALVPVLLAAVLRVSGVSSPWVLLGGGLAGVALAVGMYPLFVPDILRSLRMAAGLRARAADSAGEPRIIVYADGPFDDDNPHLKRVYEMMRSFGPEIDIRRLHLGDCLRDGWKQKFTRGASRSRARRIVHVHYPAYLYEGNTLPLAVLHGLKNAALLLALRISGYRFVLTLHDSGAHDFPWRAWERLAMTVLVQSADLTATLSEAGAELLFVGFGRTTGIRIARHCVYASDGFSAERRQRKRVELGLSEDARACLLFGSVKPYKGYDSIVRILAGMGSEAPTLLCAGKGMTGVAAEAEGAGLRTIVLDRFISEEETAALMDAADFGALPYRRILHSGTAMLFASHACPVVAPRMGVFADHAREYRIGIYYEADSADDLRHAIREAAKRGRQAFADAFPPFFADHRPDDEAAGVRALYREVSGEEMFP